MRLDQLAISVIEQIAGRLLRRLALAIAIVVLTIVALYHFGDAAVVALDNQFGFIHAHLIMGAIFMAAAFVALVILWAMRGKAANSAPPLLSGSREMRLAMLIEAVMLGYALSQKGDRTR
jgi:hypothetical protein